MANPLEIDSKNLGYDFPREWGQFKITRVHTFLILLLEKRIADSQRILETCAVEEVRYWQGQIHEARQILHVLKSDNVIPSLKPVLEYLDK